MLEKSLSAIGNIVLMYSNLTKPNEENHRMLISTYHKILGY